jgi:hypothetical protein
LVMWLMRSLMPEGVTDQWSQTRKVLVLSAYRIFLPVLWRHPWYRHWVEEGFRAIESLVEGKPFCFGNQPSLADVALVPQVYNARRFNVPLDPFPKIAHIDAVCTAIKAFADAAPEATTSQAWTRGIDAGDGVAQQRVQAGVFITCHHSDHNTARANWLILPCPLRWHAYALPLACGADGPTFGPTGLLATRSGR